MAGRGYCAFDDRRVTEISLDHDLGDDEHGTGMKPPKIRVHSANPAARARMEAAIASIERHANLGDGHGY